MTLHVDDKGRGPAVVLLHGTPMAPSHLRPLADRLSERWRVLLVHLPGYGRSAPLEPCSLQRSLEAIEHALETRHLRDVHLIGVGAGGYRALAVTGSRRVRARSVALLGGFASLDAADKQRLAAFADMLKAGVDRRLLVEAMLTPRGESETRLRVDVERWATAVSHEYLGREIESLVDAPGICRVLEALLAPILWRVGTLDSTIVLENARLFAKSFQITLEEVENTGHALLCEDFEGTVASLERFLQSAEPRHMTERPNARGYWR